jgi:hypothetical protein
MEAEEMASAGALRRREWRARRRASRRQECACCGRLFVPSRADAAFCCPGCRQLAYRRRRVAGVEASQRPRNGPWRVCSAPGPPNTPAVDDGPPGAALGLTVRAANGKMIDVRALIG